MPYVSGADLAYLFFDGLDVAISNNQLEIADEAVIKRRRPLGQAYPKAIATSQYEGTMSLSGWLDTDTEPQLGRLTGDEKVVSALVEGNTAGVHFWGARAAYVAGVKLGESEDDIVSLDPTISVGGAIDYGLIVAAYAARTTAGNTDASYVDLGAAATGGGHAYIHIPALTLGGYTNCVVTVRHSTDHTTFTNHTAFTAITGTGAQVLTLTGTVNRYLSISWAWTGSGSNPSISCFVGVGVE